MKLKHKIQPHFECEYDSYTHNLKISNKDIENVGEKAISVKSPLDILQAEILAILFISGCFSDLQFKFWKVYRARNWIRGVF